MNNSFVRLLVITDHHNHQAYESLYPLLRAMYGHPACKKIVVISRAHPGNEPFFVKQKLQKVYGIEVDSTFDLEHSREALFSSPQAYSPTAFHQVLLRLPKPNPPDWFAWLESTLGSDKIINRPGGILKTGSKAYLQHFPGICPPLQLCHTLEEVDAFRQRFPIVLKPLSEAGGRGLVKIDGDRVWEGEDELSWQEYIPKLRESLQESLLAMKYLRRVGQGDKRVLVVNGKIVGASLRLPAKDSWLCNVNMGGHAIASKPTAEEENIAKITSAALKKEGVIIYGFDTLEDDDGKRILSEINASNAGGFLPAQELSGEPVIERTAEFIWNFLLVEKEIKNLL